MENKINVIAWLHNADGLHTHGIEILTLNNVLIVEMERILINTCKRFSCHYFVQGKRFGEYGKITSWLFVEFFGESDHDKILQVVESFGLYWQQELYNNSVLLDEPTRELLESLDLF